MCLIPLLACQQESGLTFSNSVESPLVQEVHVLSQDEIFGKWTLITLDGSEISIVNGDESLTYLEFGPPCYETSSGHCNDAFDGGWEPSAKHNGRLSIRGYTGCNWFGSEAILNGAGLDSKPVTATQRGCGNMGSQETQILSILSGKSVLAIQDGTMSISDEEGGNIGAVRLSSRED